MISNKSFCHHDLLDFKNSPVLNPKFLLASNKTSLLKNPTHHLINETGVQKFTIGQYQCLILSSRRMAFFSKVIFPGSIYVGLWLTFLMYFSRSLIWPYLYLRTMVSSFFKASRCSTLQLSRCHVMISSSICLISSFIYTENAKAHPHGTLKGDEE